MEKRIKRLALRMLAKMGRKFTMKELTAKGNIYDFSTIDLEGK